MTDNFIFDILKALILGIVEGITEFLPISSTGHLIIVNQWISFEENFTKMFDIVIQLGAILSVIIYFRHKLLPIGTQEEKKKVITLWMKTLLGILPAIFAGVLLKESIEYFLFNPITVAIALIIGGIILIILEKKKITPSIESLEQLNYKTVLLIGIAQCVAMIPGVSRSAATIVGAMLLGVSRVVAIEFSFFLAIPTMIAASGYSLLKEGFAMAGEEALILATGFVTSFVVAWAVIALFMKYIKNNNFIAFGYYRIILGLIVLAYFLLT